MNDESPEPELPPAAVIVGPTAVGKSRLALALAEKFDADIVSADSRQVYRYMDIGTDKPSHVDRAKVRHFMLDLVEPDDTYSAQRFASEAGRVIRKIARSRRLPLVVGGTGFYIRALFDALDFPPVPPDPKVREELLEFAADMGAEALHDRLRSLDPRSAVRVHPNNVPRVVRALEIVSVLGRPVPDVAPSPSTRSLFIGLTIDRAKLRQIADQRVTRQFDGGLVAEVEDLLHMKYDPSAPALDGFGYRQVVAYLRGQVSLDEATERYRIATHKYIRRQMTWFRRDPRITWIENDERAVERVAGLVEAWLPNSEWDQPPASEPVDRAERL